MNKDNLEKLFHQPTRLQLMSELCAGKTEKTFNEVKEICNLTDGNLSRHLQALEKANAIKIKKQFIDLKPQTTISATKTGRDNFIQYLTNLEALLKKSRRNISS